MYTFFEKNTQIQKLNFEFARQFFLNICIDSVKNWFKKKK